MEETITIFPTDEHEALTDTIFAFILYHEDDTVEPRMVFDPNIIDENEATEIAEEIIEILQKRNIIFPTEPILN